jgi:aminoglycoside 3-N-acetyltransferase
MNKTEIKKSLKELGLKNGDTVIIHSSLASIGHVEGGADTVIDAFLETVGQEGTIVAPVFGNLGILTQTLKNRDEAVVSDSPKGTVAAIGADAEFICRDHWKADTAHGHNTPYLKIAGQGGYICLLGVDQDRNTTLHSVEALLELPYLNETSAAIETAEGKIEKIWKYYPGPHRDFIGLDKIMRNNGQMKLGKIGNAVVRLMKSKDLIDTFTELGKTDPAFCLCDNENCADCVKQHAVIRKGKIAEEDFKLSVSSSVAGRYIPEMVENLEAAGIDYIELDIIQGKPAHKFPADKLKKAVEEFKENNINVSALRLPAVYNDIDQIFESIKNAGIKSVIIPLTDSAEKFIKQAEKANIEISFTNIGVSGTYAAEIIKKISAAKLKVGFVFSPANFAKAGEMPFLQSFQQGKFRKYTTQLDIEDALFDGTPTTWANGNAEIKELVSILRCASFSGFMTISGLNRNSHKTKDLAEKFLDLLK